MIQIGDAQVGIAKPQNILIVGQEVDERIFCDNRAAFNLAGCIRLIKVIMLFSIRHLVRHLLLPDDNLVGSVFLRVPVRIQLHLTP